MCAYLLTEFSGAGADEVGLIKSQGSIFPEKHDENYTASYQTVSLIDPKIRYMLQIQGEFGILY